MTTLNPLKTLLFTVSFSWLTGTALAETKTIAAVPIGHHQLNFVEAGKHTLPASITPIITSKLNQLYLEERDLLLVENMYLYNEGLEINAPLHKWSTRTFMTYRAKKTVEESLSLALEWVGTHKAKKLDFRWFSTGSGAVTRDALETVLRASSSFEFYHVGAVGEVEETSALIEAIKKLEQDFPKQVSYFRITRPVTITITE